MQEQNNPQEPVLNEAVGFPTPPPATPKKGGLAKWIIFVVLLLIILGAGVFFLLKSSNEAIEAPVATPNIQALINSANVLRQTLESVKF